MSNEISLQADVGNVPNNAVAVLSSISPFIQAVSADNVSPLAVVQVEAIGSCFHLNGELAAKVPDLFPASEIAPPVEPPAERVRSYGLWVAP